jgi:DNA-binding GntR family transcriptional regulator
MLDIVDRARWVPAPSPDEGDDVAESLAEVAYAEIRDRIIRLEMAPGSLVVEERLMGELGVSRTPLREAIKRLAYEGFIVILPRRGTLVSEISISQPGELAEVRATLEGLCARLAAARHTEADRLVLEGFRQEMVSLAPAASQQVVMDLDARFHRAVHRMAHNPLLSDALNIYFNRGLRIWNAIGPRLTEGQSVFLETVNQVKLIDAIEAHDGERAAELAQGHVIETANWLSNAR